MLGQERISSLLVKTIASFLGKPLDSHSTSLHPSGHGYLPASAMSSDLTTHIDTEAGRIKRRECGPVGPRATSVFNCIAAAVFVLKKTGIQS